MDGLARLEGVFSGFSAPGGSAQPVARQGERRPPRAQGRTGRILQRLNKIFYAGNEAAAKAALFAVKDGWRKWFPSAVGRLEKDLDWRRTCFPFEATSRTGWRTRNPIERLNKEFERRTKAREVRGGEIPTSRCLA